MHKSTNVVVAARKQQALASNDLKHNHTQRPRIVGRSRSDQLVGQGLLDRLSCVRILLERFHVSHTIRVDKYQLGRRKRRACLRTRIPSFNRGGGCIQQSIQKEQLAEIKIK